LAGDEEVKEAEQNGFGNNLNKFFFFHRIMKLVDRYRKCLELQGDYVE